MLLPHARGFKFESLRGSFPSRWESVGFCPVDASIRGWQGLPSGMLLVTHGWQNQAAKSPSARREDHTHSLAEKMSYNAAYLHRGFERELKECATKVLGNEKRKTEMSMVT
ncbi:hypothetical protein Tco_0446030 [Tanacetum coccineum]